MKAINASANESVSVTMTSVKHANAHAPTGNGLKMSPEIVVRKIASSCHACVVTCEGLGIAKRTRRPIDTETISGRNFVNNLSRPSKPVVKVRKVVGRRVGERGGEGEIVTMEVSATVVEEVCISYLVGNCIIETVSGGFEKGGNGRVVACIIDRVDMCNNIP